MDVRVSIERVRVPADVRPAQLQEAVDGALGARVPRGTAEAVADAVRDAIQKEEAHVRAR
jgi:hypothetical protein